MKPPKNDPPKTAPNSPRRGLDLVSIQTFDDLHEFMDKHMDSLYGCSPFMMDLIIERIPETAASGLHVLVTGETGTGKEIVVNEIAKAAGISNLVRVNCAAISPDLIESELFGYKKGAFTGAISDKKGYFDQCNNEGIFLDEIGELSTSVQAKLLRVIENKEFLRVGDTKPTKVVTRLFAATNKPMDLRSDIAWRFPERIDLPPLHERREDVFILLHRLLKERLGDRASTDGIDWLLTPTTLFALLFSPWNGNVRELRNAIDTSIARYECRTNHKDYLRIPFYYWPSAWGNGPSRGLAMGFFSAWQEIVSRVRSTKGGKTILSNEFSDSTPAEYFAHTVVIPQIDRYHVSEFALPLRVVLKLFVFSLENFVPEEVARKKKNVSSPLWQTMPHFLKNICNIWNLPRETFGGMTDTDDESESGVADMESGDKTWKEVEKSYFDQLRKRHSSLNEAAKVSGILVSTLSGRMKRLGISGYRK